MHVIHTVPNFDWIEAKERHFTHQNWFWISFSSYCLMGMHHSSKSVYFMVGLPVVLITLINLLFSQAKLGRDRRFS